MTKHLVDEYGLKLQGSSAFGSQGLYICCRKVLVPDQVESRQAAPLFQTRGHNPTNDYCKQGTKLLALLIKLKLQKLGLQPVETCRATFTM